MPINHSSKSSKKVATTSSPNKPTQMAQAMLDKMSPNRRRRLQQEADQPESTTATPPVCLVCDHFGLSPVGHRPGDKACPKFPAKEGGWRRVDYRERLELADNNAARRAKAALIKRLAADGQLSTKAPKPSRSATVESGSSHEDSRSPSPIIKKPKPSVVPQGPTTSLPTSSTTKDKGPPSGAPVDQRLPLPLRKPLPSNFRRPDFAQVHFARQAAREQRATITVEMQQPQQSEAAAVLRPTPDPKIITATITATVSKKGVHIDGAQLKRLPADGLDSTKKRIREDSFRHQLKKRGEEKADNESRKEQDRARIANRKAALEALLALPDREAPNDFAALLDPDSIHYLGERLTRAKYDELCTDRPKAVEKWMAELKKRIWHLDPATDRSTRSEHAVRFPTTAALVEQVALTLPALGDWQKQQTTADKSALLQRAEPRGNAKKWTTQQVKQLLEDMRAVAPEQRAPSPQSVVIIDSSPASPSPPPSADPAATQSSVSAKRIRGGLPDFPDPLDLTTDPILINRIPDLQRSLSPTSEALALAYHSGWQHLRRLESLLLLRPSYTAAALALDNAQGPATGDDERSTVPATDNESNDEDPTG
uniref:Uncharacterized protein n=1 Tax=Globodera rostochiensis TaxID=31243 RepID=A0A914H6J7_GLORO